MMSSMSRPAATSDANKVVDLERGLMAAATEEEAELIVVKPRLATCIRATSDVIVVAYALIIICAIVLVVKDSKNWSDPLAQFTVLACSVCLLLALVVMPKLKDALVKRHAMKHTLATDSDVTTKLLASKK